MSGWACLTTSLSRQPHRIPSSRDRPGVGWPNAPSIGVCALTHKRFPGTGLGWAPSSSRTRRRRLSALPRESCRLVSRDQPANDPQRTCKSVEVRRRSAVQSLRTTRAAPALTRRRAARRPSSGPALLHIAPAMSRAPLHPRACQAPTVRLVSCAGASRRERSCSRPRHPLQQPQDQRSAGTRAPRQGPLARSAVAGAALIKGHPQVRWQQQQSSRLLWAIHRVKSTRKGGDFLLSVARWNFKHRKGIRPCPLLPPAT